MVVTSQMADGCGALELIGSRGGTVEQDLSTFRNARHTTSRIVHHTSCTLNYASLAFQRDAELRRLALVGTLQQRQGALAGMRVDLRARFYAPLGPTRAIFLLALFFIIIIGGFA